MAANLCVEGHLRELVEQGFEVVVVRDATAGPGSPKATATSPPSSTSATWPPRRGRRPRPSRR
ncbi:hypothetical protein ABZ656_54530 [Streptomyces sp. NPDC007095]|uniref:hypothetical protein n=1 Tax=Streptomyces sp. NPDC007095 TaxID=3154482 RepID=UPI0033EC46B3